MISRLIEALTKIKEEHGDLPVETMLMEGDNIGTFEVNDVVTAKNDKEEIFVFIVSDLNVLSDGTN